MGQQTSSGNALVQNALPAHGSAGAGVTAHSGSQNLTFGLQPQWTGWDVIPLLLVVTLFALSMWYVWDTNDRKEGRYRVSFWLNGLAVVAGAVASLYPMKVDWLPETNLYAVRLIGWIAIFLLGIRFLWTLFLYRDKDGILLKGNHRDLDHVDDEHYRQIRQSDEAFQWGQLLLHYPHVRTAFQILKGNLTGNELYYWAVDTFLDYFEDEVEEKVEIAMETYLWMRSDVDDGTANIPADFQRCVRKAARIQDVVHYGGGDTKAKGLAFYVKGKDVVLFIGRADEQLINPTSAVRMLVAFDTFLEHV